MHDLTEVRSTESIRALILSKKSLTMLGLKGVLNAPDDISIVAECTSAACAVEQIAQTQPNILVVEMQNPDFQAEVLAALAPTDTMSGIIFINSFFGEQGSMDALEGWTTGLCSAHVTAETLACMIRCVHEGYSVFPEAVGKRAKASMERNAVPQQKPHASKAAPQLLTEREIEVLKLIASGMTNQQIARALLVSHAGAKVTVRSIFSKLGVEDRTAAAVEAVRLGILAT